MVSMERELWKRVWTCRKTDYRINECITIAIMDVGKEISDSKRIQVFTKGHKNKVVKSCSICIHSC